MLRASPPVQSVEVEKMRYRDGLDESAQLRLTLQQNVVVTHRVVLDVPIGMRRKRRAVRIHRVAVCRAGTVIAVTTTDVAIGDPPPLPGGEIEGVDIGTEIVVVPASENDHRSAGAKSRRVNGAVPCLGDRAESCDAVPWLSLIHISEPTRLGMIS